MQIKKSKNVFTNLNPVHRVIVSALFSILTYFLAHNQISDFTILSTLLWDAFALTYIVLSWTIFFTSTTEHITKKARKDDGSKIFVFFVVIFASFASMITVVILVTSNSQISVDEVAYLPIIISGIFLSWTMVHTTFCFHYAYLYYDNELGTDTNLEGLKFPNEEHPDYIDFAYFSFVVGMTFQVSDVQITTRKIRRLALFHSLLSFALNTFVVALTINLIAGIRK